MLFDALIFDLDGTLWNASQASANGWNKAIQSLGLGVEVTAKDIESIAGLPLEDCIKTLVPQLKASKFDRLVPLINQEEEKAVSEIGGELYPGVEQTIRTLSKQVNLMIVSNCQEWYLELFLEKSGLGQFFNDTDCHGRTQQAKDFTLKGVVGRNFLKRPVYIGDTVWDQTAARKAGVPFIHASYGFGSLPEAQNRINSFREVEDILLFKGLK